MRHVHIGAVIVSMTAVLIGQNLPANANTAKKYINIQPIEICDNVGARCAGTPIFVSETKAIWEKAGIDVNFLPTRQLNESLFLIATETAIDYGLFSGAPRTGISPDPHTVNVWFAQDLFYRGGTRFGRGNIGGNKLVLNSSAISSFNDGKGRIDTLAHELGHNLGLYHHHDGRHLMAAGNYRYSPKSLKEITTNQTSLFSQQEISTIFASPFVQDSPQIVVEGGEFDPLDPGSFWTVKFLSGSNSLTKLTLNLSSVSTVLNSANATSGATSGLFQLGNTSGISEGAIAITETYPEDHKLVLDLTKGDFTVGDSFEFGINSALLPTLENLGFDPGDLTGSLLSFDFSDGYQTASQLSERVLLETVAPENTPVPENATLSPLLPDVANELAVVPIPSDHGHSHGPEADHDHGHSHENQLVVMAAHDHGLEPDVETEPGPEVTPMLENSPEVIFEPQVVVAPKPDDGVSLPPSEITVSVGASEGEAESDQGNSPNSNVSLEAETETQGSLAPETVVEPTVEVESVVEPEAIILPALEVESIVKPEAIILPTLEMVDEPEPVVNALATVSPPINTYVASIVEDNAPSPVSVPAPSGLLGIAFGGMSLLRGRWRGQADR